MDGNPPISGRSVTSRALDLLGAFDVGHPTLTLSELAARRDMPMATAHRLVGELEAWRALERNADNRYQAARLEFRAQPPRIEVAEPGINVVVSDDHRLPGVVARSVYASDGFSGLRAHEGVVGRVHAVDNEGDDPSGARLDEALTGFVEEVVRPYRALSG
ncbi:helix-turn-helix domain-containing protein [Saccharothrix lopnurensis]|uniref:Helix-turn-helix domain-containing protein n=1 Tax=Saccharothrix lopnurensis TaxID=1670621 RepID=A0ABW1PEV3_9PSEU